MRTATPESPSSIAAGTALPEPVAPQPRLVVLLSLETAELILPRAPERIDTDGLAMRGAFNLRYITHCGHEARWRIWSPPKYILDLS